jgi:hypothetical protein
VVEPLNLRFHKSLYDGDAVARAANRFAALGPSEIGESDADWLVSVQPLRESVRQRLADELSNHALFETILARRAQA